MRRNKMKLFKALALKLDLGCGPNKREGFIGIDSREFKGVDQVVDLAAKFKETGTGKLVFMQWPWKDGTVEEVHASHFVEHLDAEERINFANQLYRILIPGGTATVITPNWASCRAYGDLTHKWPPVSEFWFYYLSKEWRAGNAPHNDFYTCDFEVTWGYTMHPSIQNRNQETQTFALNNYKESALDIVSNWKKK